MPCVSLKRFVALKSITKTRHNARKNINEGEMRHVYPDHSTHYFELTEYINFHNCIRRDNIPLEGHYHNGIHCILRNKSNVGLNYLSGYPKYRCVNCFIGTDLETVSIRSLALQ